ncbi:MAG: DMT family transporter [Alphaproteobacteria bacterium]|nr:DMT family transporter [Alphaproteobacteria bacterium]
MTQPNQNTEAHASSVARTTSWFVLLGIGLAWGLAAPLGKHAVSSGHHALVVSFWNVATAAVVVTAIANLSNRTIVLDRETVRFFLICGLLGRAIPLTFAYVAFQQLPVGIVVMLITTTPLLTLITAVLAKIDVLDARKLAGLLLGLGAVAAILLPGGDSNITSRPIQLIIPLIIALSYALEGTFIKSRKPGVLDPIDMVLGSTWAAVLMLLPFVVVRADWFIFASPSTVELAVVGGAVLHLAGYLAFVWLIGQTGPVFTSQVGYIVTVSGVVFGITFFGETHPPTVWLALIVLIAGLALVKPRA